MNQTAATNADEFEVYIARRRARLRLAMILGVAAFIAVVAIPYAFMRAGALKQDTFEIFVAIDLFILAGLARAFFIYLRDRTGIGIG
jgi:hypothetical protein